METKKESSGNEEGSTHVLDKESSLSCLPLLASTFALASSAFSMWLHNRSERGVKLSPLFERMASATEVVLTIFLFIVVGVIALLFLYAHIAIAFEKKPEPGEWDSTEYVPRKEPQAARKVATRNELQALQPLERAAEVRNRLGHGMVRLKPERPRFRSLFHCDVGFVHGFLGSFLYPLPKTSVINREADELMINSSSILALAMARALPNLVERRQYGRG